MRRMRWLALGVLAVAVLTGCSGPAGVDGDLTDDWTALPEPKPFVPASGVCHAGFKQLTEASQGVYFPLDCGGQHGAETVHVGQFTGADAERATMPPRGTKPTLAAFAECDAKAKEYVGGDWRHGLLKLDLILPSLQAWAGGGRWFRCDLRQLESIDTYSGTSRAAPLKDALKDEPKLLLGCFRPVLSKDGRTIDVMNAAACTTPHRAEFVGIWTAPDTSYTDFIKNTQRILAGCGGVLAAFAKLPNDRNLTYRVGTTYGVVSEEEWRSGDRGIKCYLWMYDREVRRSMKGAGPGVLPVR
ncbi:septum formation family protein [Phytohabitans houttuyneae]|nr:septum formation family protein [Phytohabitans houttuyneae]